MTCHQVGYTLFFSHLIFVLVGCGSPGQPTVKNARFVGKEELQVIHPDLDFEGIRDLVVTPTAVWVLDGGEPFLTRVSLDDGSAIQFGRKGRGPEELRNPWSIQWVGTDGEDTIMVWDLGNSRVSRFDGDGFLLDSQKVPRDNWMPVRSNIREVSYVDPFRIRRVGGGFAHTHFPSRVNRTSDFSRGVLQIGDPHLNPNRRLVRLADHVPKVGSSLREWGAMPVWDACGEGVSLWSPALSQALWIDAEGRVVDRVQVAIPSHPISVDDIATYLRRMARLELGPDFAEAGIDFSRLARQYRGRFAESSPQAMDLRCGADSTIWLRLFGTSHDALGRGQKWIQLSREGLFRELAFHHRFCPLAFGDKAVFGLLEATSGAQHLARWDDREESDQNSLSSTPE